MSQIVDALNASNVLTIFWLSCLWVAAGFLLVLGLAIFFQKQRAVKFLGGYASSITINTLEALLRFLAGIAFVGASIYTKFPIVSFAFGVMLAVTAIPILLLPKLHSHFARWAIPFAIRILPVYGAGAILLSGLLVYALL